MTPEALFDRLKTVFYKELPDTPTDAKQVAVQSRIQAQVLNVVKWWVTNQWHDFGLSSNMNNHLDEFLHVVAYTVGPCMKEAEDLLILASSQRTKFETLLSTFDDPQDRREAKLKTKMDITTMIEHSDPIEVSEQLSLYNHRLFTYIHPVEYLNEVWKKDNDSSPSFRYFVDRFDKESYWVASELVAIRDLRSRALVLKQFIEIVKVSLIILYYRFIQFKCGRGLLFNRVFFLALY